MRYNSCFMVRFTRRMFLAGSALAAAAQPARPRNLLTSAWTPEKIAASLAPRGRFHPYPTAEERDAWLALPEDARRTLVEHGDSALKTAWEPLPATQFLEYKRNGNRSHFDNARSHRREHLERLVIAECVEAKGRFTDEIANGIWTICEESFWGSNAHLNGRQRDWGLPDVNDPIVELFGAETAALLAWTNYLLDAKLAAVSPAIGERIRMEIDRRLLTPALTKDYGWMGMSGGAPNNWDPWISSNWLTCALLVERDEKRRQAAVARILRCLDNFLNHYADDGGCDEGPGYWGRAGASLFDNLELLRLASGGAMNGFSLPLVHQIGLYICRAHIYNEYYTNFADAPARVNASGDLIYRFGERVGDETMMAHGAFATFYRDAAGLPGDSIGRQLPALFHLAEFRKAKRAQALLRDVVAAGNPGDGGARSRRIRRAACTWRRRAGTTPKATITTTSAIFWCTRTASPPSSTSGSETYTAKTFSAQRYDIWTMQSAYHNCPTIDGVMQAAGREYAASDVSYEADDKAAEFRLNLVKAYPKEAHIESWKRRLRLDRGRMRLHWSDDYALNQPAKVITLTLMTPCAVTKDGAGRLALAGPWASNTMRRFFSRWWRRSSWKTTNCKASGASGCIASCCEQRTRRRGQRGR